MSMRAWEVSGSFGLDQLSLVERPEPVLGPHQVRIAVRAASLNYRDLLMVQGVYNPRQPLPLIPVSDGAGEVVEVGSEVRGWKPGDRVCGHMPQAWLAGRPHRGVLASTLGGPMDGALAESMVVSEFGLVRAPKHMSFVEAATLPCAALTAWNALVEQGELLAGQTVLILGTGGVAIFALQIAGLLGARAIVTSSSDDKLVRARELGAWQTLNYRSDPSWSKTVFEMTEREGVDLTIEVGGAGTLEQSVRATRIGGRIVLIGNLSGNEAKLNLVPVFMKQIRLQGILVGHLESFQSMNRALETGMLRPVVDRVFPFAEAVEAFRYLEGGQHFGKICIEVAA